MNTTNAVKANRFAMGILKMVEEYKKDPNVVFAQPNFTYTLHQIVPQGPYQPAFSSLAFLHPVDI